MHPGNGTLPRAGGWVAVGHSDDERADVAGAAAAAAALASADARLLVVFCSDAYDLEALLAAIRGAAGRVPLIGCSTAGEIATGGPGDAGVVVTALGGPRFSVSTAVSRGVAGRLRAAGAEAAASLHEIDPREHRVLMLLSDGLSGNQQEVVRGAYSVAGASVPLVGGCAGDDLKMRTT